MVQPVTASATYLPGGWVGIAGHDTWLLARLTPEHPLVTECWTLVDNGADADHVLGAILQAGFNVVSDFALATTRGDSVRVLLRGTAQASWASSGQATTMSAESAPIWQEHTLPITEGTLTLRRPGAATGPGFPVRLAVIMSDELSSRPTASSESLSAAAQSEPANVVDLAPPPMVPVAAPEAQTAPEPAIAPEPVPTAEVSPGPASSPEPVLAAATVAADPPADFAPSGPSDLSADAIESPGAVPLDDSSADEVEDNSFPEVPLDIVEDISDGSVDGEQMLDSQPEIESSPAPELDERAPSADVEASGDEDTGTGYDHLFGATQNLMSLPAESVEEALEPTQPEPSPAPASSQQTPVDQDAPKSYATLPPDDTLLPHADDDISLIDALPWQLGDPALNESAGTESAAAVQDFRAPVPVPSSFAISDDQSSEQTISRAKLLASAPAVASLDPRPTVLAARCAAGHLSPANAGTCRVCRAPMPTQEPFTVQRPLLGTLRFSTGDVVSLDKGVVMGRAPHSPLGEGRERPHVMQLASPENDISRTHLEVSLDGWHVYVEDMGSTNGTAITLPGQTPQQLRAHDVQLIEPGTVVTLADEVSFTFEVDT